jgi:hypothetical protein
MFWEPNVVGGWLHLGFGRNWPLIISRHYTDVCIEGKHENSLFDEI